MRQAGSHYRMTRNNEGSMIGSNNLRAIMNQSLQTITSPKQRKQTASGRRTALTASTTPTSRFNQSYSRRAVIGNLVKDLHA